MGLAEGLASLGISGGTGSGASSVAANDTTLTVSPTTGAVKAAVNPLVWGHRQLADLLGADPTGAVDLTTAYNTAVTNLGSSPGVIEFGRRQLRFLWGRSLRSPTPASTSSAKGISATVLLDYQGSAGDLLRMYTTLGAGYGGGVLGFTIDGTHAAAGCCGLHLGDGYLNQIDIRCGRIRAPPRSAFISTTRSGGPRGCEDGSSLPIAPHRRSSISAARTTSTRSFRLRSGDPAHSTVRPGWCSPERRERST